MKNIVKKNFTRHPLTSRNRFNRTMQFQSVDRIPNFEFGFWPETYNIWHKQGLPEDINDEFSANNFFGLDYAGDISLNTVPVNYWHSWFVPNFEEEVIMENNKHKIIIQSGIGAKCIIHKDSYSNIPKYLEYPLKNKKDWNLLKKRLDCNDPRKFPPNWNQLIADYAERDYPLGVNIGSLLGFTRELMGFENISMAFYDMPDLMDEIAEYWCEFNICIVEKILSDVDADFGIGWEDICFKNGPMISPKMHKKFLLPRYKKIADVLHKYGIHVIFTDCDGNIMQIVEQWIDAGYNCVFPIEVAAGSDPVLLRKRYGQNILLIGGVDKRALINGKRTIDNELKRLEPIIYQGGFIPHVDHRCPPDVTFKNYQYYLNQKKKILGF